MADRCKVMERIAGKDQNLNLCSGMLTSPAMSTGALKRSKGTPVLNKPMDNRQNKFWPTSIPDTAWQNRTLVDCVKFWSEKDPDYPAFIFWSSAGRQVMTRKHVLDLSSRFANRLNSHGVRAGDVVCISLPNSPQRVVVEFGIHMAGAVSLNGASLQTDGEDLITTFHKTNCSAIVANIDDPVGAWQLTKHSFDAFKLYKNHLDVQSKRVPSLKKVFIAGYSGSENDLLKTLKDEKSYVCMQRSAKDTCAILTTSGSTGYSKLVPHNHTYILMTYFTFCDVIGSHSAFTLFDNGHFGWIGGFPAFYLYAGGTHVAIDDSYNNGTASSLGTFIWDVLRKEQIQYGMIFPASLKEINDARRKDEVNAHRHQLITVLTGGQPITKENMSVIGELTEGVGLLYGMTETGLVAGRRIDAQNISEFQDNMVGFPFEGFGIKIVDDNLNSVPALSRGEVLVHSTFLTTGYIKGESSSDFSFLQDGWFRTGDIGYLTQAGCLFVEGRGCDAINIGDDVIYPTWLEQLLIKCPGIKDVVVVPIPDKILHHQICACVRVDREAEVKPSADDILNFYKKGIVQICSVLVPKFVIFFDEFPRTKTDKLDRRKVAELAKKRLIV